MYHFCLFLREVGNDAFQLEGFLHENDTWIYHFGLFLREVGNDAVQLEGFYMKTIHGCITFASFYAKLNRL